MPFTPDFTVHLQDVRIIPTTPPPPTGTGVIRWRAGATQAIEGGVRVQLIVEVAGGSSAPQAIVVPISPGGSGVQHTHYSLFSAQSGGTKLSSPTVTIAQGAVFGDMWLEVPAAALTGDLEATFTVDTEAPAFLPEGWTIESDPEVTTVQLLNSASASTVAFNIDQSSVDETQTTTHPIQVDINPAGTGAESVIVSRNASSTAALTTNYTLDQTLPWTATFGAGVTRRVLNVTPVPNNQVDVPPLNLILDLGTPVGTSLSTTAPIQHTLTFNDTSQAPANNSVINWESPFRSVSEPGTLGATTDYAVLVSIAPDPVEVVTADITLALGSVPGTDFILLTSQITVQPEGGEPLPGGAPTTHPVRFRVVGNGVFEAARTVTLTLGNIAGATAGSDLVQTIELVSLDPAPTVEFTEPVSAQATVGIKDLTLQFSNPSAIEQSIVYTHAGTGANPAVEGTSYEIVTPSPIIFPPWAPGAPPVPEQTLQYRVLDPPGSPVPVELTFSLGAHTGGATNGTIATHVVTITDPVVPIPEGAFTQTTLNAIDNAGLTYTINYRFTDPIPFPTPATITWAVDTAGLTNPAAGGDYDVSVPVASPIVLGSGQQDQPFTFTVNNVTGNKEFRISVTAVTGGGAQAATAQELVVTIVDNVNGVDGNLRDRDGVALAPERQPYDLANPHFRIQPGQWMHTAFGGGSGVFTADANPLTAPFRLQGGNTLTATEQVWRGLNPGPPNDPWQTIAPDGPAAGANGIPRTYGRGYERNPVLIRIEGFVDEPIKLNGDNINGADDANWRTRNIIRDIVFYGQTGPATDRITSLFFSSGASAGGTSRRSDNIRLENLSVRKVGGTHPVGGGFWSNDGMLKLYGCRVEGEATAVQGLVGMKWGTHFPTGMMLDVRSTEYEPAQEHYIYQNNAFGGKYDETADPTLGEIDAHNALTCINITSRAWRANPQGYSSNLIGSGRTHIQVRQDWAHLESGGGGYPVIGNQQMGRLLYLRCADIGDCQRHFSGGGACLTVSSHGAGDPTAVRSDIYIKDCTCDGPWAMLDSSNTPVTGTSQHINKRALEVWAPKPTPVSVVVNDQDTYSAESAGVPSGANTNGVYGQPPVIIDGFIISGAVPDAETSWNTTRIVVIGGGARSITLRKFSFNILPQTAGVGIGIWLTKPFAFDYWRNSDMWHTLGSALGGPGTHPQIPANHYPFLQNGGITWDLHDPTTDVAYVLSATNLLTDYPGWNQTNPSGVNFAWHGRNAGPCDITGPTDPADPSCVVLDADQMNNGGGVAGVPYDGTDPSSAANPWTSPC